MTTRGNSLSKKKTNFKWKGKYLCIITFRNYILTTSNKFFKVLPLQRYRVLNKKTGIMVVFCPIRILLNYPYSEREGDECKYWHDWYSQRKNNKDVLCVLTYLLAELKAEIEKFNSIKNCRIDNQICLQISPELQFS